MSGTYGSHYYLRLYANEDSYSITDNTSTVTFTLKLYFDGSSYYSYTNYTTYGNIYAWYIQTDASISSISFSSGVSKEITLMSVTRTVPHNSDGTMSVSGSGTWDTSTTRIGSATVSGTLTLTTIPRKSTISATSANIGSTSTITVTRKSSSFTHTITYSFAGTSTITGTIASNSSSTSISWTIPTSFYQYLTTKKSGTVTLTCTTYSGSTTIGTSTCTLTATASESSCKPTISSGSVVDTNSTTIALTGDSSTLIINKSTAKLTATVKLLNYATLSSIKINGSTLSSSDYSSSTSSGTTTISITKSYSNVSVSSFAIVVTDSRGYTNSNYTVTPTNTITYVPLTLSATVERPSPTTGEIAVTSASGNYFNGSFGSVSNSLTVTWSYKLSTASTYTTGGTLTFSLSGNTFEISETSLGTSYVYTNVYNIKIVAQDALTTVTNIYTVSQGEPVFNWGEDFFNINASNITLQNVDIFKTIYNKIMPVGYIYISYSSTSPATLFGGSWTQIKDVFLLCCGSSYSAGSTGGEATHKLTVSEMPSHSHSFQDSGRVMYWDSGLAELGDINNDGSGSVQYTWNVGTNSVGGSSAHNNMPPYLAVYAWRRTALA